MIKKKVCMLGSFAVGKTSLVQQYVNSIFSEKYLTSIGVKIDQKSLIFNNIDITLLLWDIHGEDEFQKIPKSYLKGSAGYFLIMDGTRINTLSIIGSIKKMADEVLGTDTPFLVLVNKVDLSDRWEFSDEMEKEISARNWRIIKTSAKTGEGVEEAFQELTKLMMA